MAALISLTFRKIQNKSFWVHEQKSRDFKRLGFDAMFMFIRRLFTQISEEVNPNDLIGCFPPKPSLINFNLESLNWLHQFAPCFPVHADQIEIIHEPNHFYNTVLQRSCNARKRIVLASLYLGTGHLEYKLVETLRGSLERQKQLQVRVLLDFTRGTRGEPNSKSMLLPLLRDFQDQVQLSLYHTPDLRGMTKKFIPARWNELLGLQHMKVYLFDDSVLISGANLSNDYFTNRQDRYILINDKPLADFYAQLIGRVQEFSLAVKENAEVGLYEDWRILPYEGIKENFVANAKKRIKDFMRDTYLQQERMQHQYTSADTWIFPLIEMGQIGIHHDSIVTKRLLSSAMEGSCLKLATGYFNLTQQYMDTITHECQADCSILMAHPNANGFKGAKWPAGGIPDAYTLIAKNFYENLVRRKQHHRVKFFEYEKDGWTYHAKGLWYYLPHSSVPNLTLIGSSNFGERSVNRDLETQICVVTKNNELSDRLEEETTHLFRLATTAERQITTRPVPRWVQAVVKIFRNFF